MLLAIAEHADHEGKAYPGIPRLASQSRLSDRHVRRCVKQLLVSGELEIRPEPAPGGGAWYQIRLDRLTPDNLSAGSSATTEVTPMSDKKDAGASSYIKEPSTKPSIEPASSNASAPSNPSISSWKKITSGTSAYPEFFSAPKNGF